MLAYPQQRDYSRAKVPLLGGSQATPLDIFRSYLLKKIDLRPKELRLLMDAFVPEHVNRKQFLLRDGEVCKFLAFVTDGCLRNYVIGRDGKEHVVGFAIEEWWVSDPQSFLTGRPSGCHIQALEDSTILQIEKTRFVELLTLIPRFDQLVRHLFEWRIIADQKRITLSLQATAEERYLNFMEQYPLIAHRVAQTQIASYLGIAPESLSRIRRTIAERRIINIDQSAFVNSSQ